MVVQFQENHHLGDVESDFIMLLCPWLFSFNSTTQMQDKSRFYFIISCSCLSRLCYESSLQCYVTHIHFTACFHVFVLFMFCFGSCTVTAVGLMCLDGSFCCVLPDLCVYLNPSCVSSSVINYSFSLWSVPDHTKLLFSLLLLRSCPQFPVSHFPMFLPV